MAAEPAWLQCCGQELDYLAAAASALSAIGDDFEDVLSALLKLHAALNAVLEAGKISPLKLFDATQEQEGRLHAIISAQVLS